MKLNFSEPSKEEYVVFFFAMLFTMLGLIFFVLSFFLLQTKRLLPFVCSLIAVVVGLLLNMNLSSDKEGKKCYRCKSRITFLVGKSKDDKGHILCGDCWNQWSSKKTEAKSEKKEVKKLGTSSKLTSKGKKPRWFYITTIVVTIFLYILTWNLVYALNSLDIKYIASVESKYKLIEYGWLFLNIVFLLIFIFGEYEKMSYVLPISFIVFMILVIAIVSQFESTTTLQLSKNIEELANSGLFNIGNIVYYATKSIKDITKSMVTVLVGMETIYLIFVLIFSIYRLREP